MKKLVFKKPSDVFIKDDNQSLVTSKGSIADEDLRGLIDFVDYGKEANSFLVTTGVMNDFPALNMLQVLIRNQSEYLLVPQNDAILRQKRLTTYHHCLLYIAQSHSLTDFKENHHSALYKTVRTQPWCLGYHSVPTENGSEKKEIKITCPSDIYLIDDSLVLDNFPVVIADKDDSEALYQLYQKFGAKYLSECTKVERDVSGNSDSRHFL